MILTLPRGIKVDIFKFKPDELAATVKREFAEYTNGTNPDFMYQDKLCFIDLMVQRLHHADSTEKVNRLIKRTFEYQLDEYGDIMDESEFLSREFMEDCYSLGQEDHKLYSRNFTGEYLTDEKIMLVEAIVIKAVMDYTGEENERREENN